MYDIKYTIGHHFWVARVHSHYQKETRSIDGDLWSRSYTVLRPEVRQEKVVRINIDERGIQYWAEVVSDEEDHLAIPRLRKPEVIGQFKNKEEAEAFAHEKWKEGFEYFG